MNRKLLFLSNFAKRQLKHELYKTKFILFTVKALYSGPWEPFLVHEPLRQPIDNHMTTASNDRIIRLDGSSL